MAKVWIIRHGESIANAGAATPDPASIPLSWDGDQQSLRFAWSLHVEPDLIVMSPYIRTQETAQPTIQRYPEAKQEIWPIQEITFLSPVKYNNTTAAQRWPHVVDFWNKNDPDHIDGPGAESFNMMIDRVRDMVDRLKKAPEENIFVFCHERIIQGLMVLTAHPDLQPAEMMKTYRAFFEQNAVPNCAYIHAEADASSFRILTPAPIALKPKPGAATAPSP
jgi:probable phosphoglycerate mutase